MQDRVALPEPDTLFGEMVQAVVLLVERLMILEKPFRGEIVMEEFPIAPAFRLILVGDAVMLKSSTV